MCANTPPSAIVRTAAKSTSQSIATCEAAPVQGSITCDGETTFRSTAQFEASLFADESLEVFGVEGEKLSQKESQESWLSNEEVGRDTTASLGTRL